MVGCMVAKDCSMSIMQTTGSKSSSLGTPIQVISMAPVFPGEHGVQRLLINAKVGVGRATKLFELCCQLYFFNGLHEGVPHDDADISA